MANTLNLGSGNWGAKESLLLGYYEDGGKFFPETFDVTRATGGTRVNKAGLIETPAEIGSELVVNGDFSNGFTNWVTYGNTSVSNGVATIGASGNSGIYQGILTQNKSYKVTINVTSYNGVGQAQVANDLGQVLYSITEVGEQTFYFNHIIVNSNLIIRGLSNALFSIDNVSVKEYNDKNLARIDYLDDAKGALLTEPQSTNLIPYSQDLASLSAAANAVVTSNAITSPSGLLDADEITFDGTLYGRVESSISVTIGQPYTISLYLKNKDLSDTTQVWIGFSQGGQGQFVAITDEWQRYDITTNADGTTEYPRIQFSGTGSLYAWGFQTEQQPYATSYIPTEGSTVTRNKDEVTNGGDVNSFNSEEGVLYAEIAALANDGIRKYISLSDGTSGNDVRLYYSATPNQIIALSKVGGVTQFVMSFDVSDATQLNKIAVKYKENNFSLWVNGVEVATDTSGLVNAPNTLNELAFDGNGLSFFGKTKNAQVFNTALSDSDLLSLTTTGLVPYWKQYSAMATTLNYTNK